MTDGYLGWNRSTPSAVLELRKKILSVLVHTVDVSVHVNSITISPVLGLINVEFIKALSNFLWINFFRDVDHLSRILYQSTILTFRCLVWTQATPLRWVQISSFKMRLTSNQWRGHSAHVRERGEVSCSVEQLAHTRTTANPVTGCQGVQNLGRENIRSQAGGDFEFSLSVVMSLELILQIAGELS